MDPSIKTQQRLDTQTNNSKSTSKIAPNQELKNQTRLEFNQQILESAKTVSIKAGNESLSLLYQAAINGINEELEASLGPNAIGKAAEADTDVSPEATSQRILSGSLKLFESYKTNNPKLDDSEAAEKFSNIISQGISKGFAEARDILEGLKVLSGDIASNIDKTFDLVMSGISDFVSQYQDDGEVEPDQGSL